MLARLLKPYGIGPKIRLGDVAGVGGYYLSHSEPAFARSSNKSYKPYNLYAQPVELVEVVEVPAMSRRLTEDFAPVA